MAAGTEGTAPEQGPGTGRRRSNTAADKDFIAQAAATGDLKVWDNHLVWSGRTQDLMHPYQVPPDERRCRWMRQMRDDDGNQILDMDHQPLKERCPKWAMLGANICVQHAKGSKAVMDEMRDMLAGAGPALLSQLIHDGLNAVTAADRIKAINSALDRFGLRGGIEVGPDMPAWKEIMEELGKETGVTE